MPGSPESLRAAEEHRRQQLAVRAAFVREFIALWPLLDKQNVAQTSPDWLRMVTRLIERWRGPSRTFAVTYYERARLLDTGRSAPRLPDPRPLEQERIIRNLLDRGPGEMKRARLKGLSEFEASERALAASAKSGARLTLEAGRSQIEEAIKADPQALGWARITDGDPCYFCAMLAARGAVYESRETALFGEDGDRYHDSCGCQAAPVFTRSEVLPEASKRFADLWAESTAGKSGADARNAFRRALEGRGEPRGSQGSRRRKEKQRVDSDRRGFSGELAALERTLADLERRAAAGENVTAPLRYQRDRLALLRQAAGN